MDHKVVVDILVDKLAEVQIRPLSEKIAEKMAHTLVATHAYKLV